MYRLFSFIIDPKWDTKNRFFKQKIQKTLNPKNLKKKKDEEEEEDFEEKGIALL